jgi:hypothetical protein
MRDIALFVEDFAHQQIIGALLQRLANEQCIEVRLIWRSAQRGYSKVVAESRRFFRDLRAQGAPLPDMIVVATDADCKGLNERAKELANNKPPAPVVLAIPDPHVERWLLLDGAAFKALFGRGCDAPDQKCDRDRYKHRLIEEIRAADVVPAFGGIEFADDIVQSRTSSAPAVPTRRSSASWTKSGRRFGDGRMHERQAPHRSRFCWPSLYL